MAKKKKHPRYFNRDLSWLEFNERVLQEAENDQLPLLERLKFLCIVTSNFDEFYMVRVATIKRQLKLGAPSRDPSGLAPAQLLEQINERVRGLVRRKYSCLLEQVMPQLAREGIVLVNAAQWSATQRAALRERFENEIFPVLTPVRRRPEQGLPYSGNMRLHTAFLLEPGSEPPFAADPGSSLVSSPAAASSQTAAQSAPDGQAALLLAIVQIPNTLDRVVTMPDDRGAFTFTFLEQVIEQNADLLFPGYRVRESAVFRVTRDADFGVDEERDEDFVEAMEQVLEHRARSTAVRLSVNRRASGGQIPEILRTALDLTEHELFFKDDPLDLGNLMSLTAVPGFDHLRHPRWLARSSRFFLDETPIWDVLKRQDVLLHHPFVSFDPVVQLLREAAADPHVLAIKMTLYRTSGDSAIISALEQAAENGKQVTALVEIKARFDEQRNITWAERLERAGAIVVHGIAHLKVHAKAMLIVRREANGVQRYLHVGTGNYNESTARLYTDVSLLTTREDLAYEVGLFFNAITGYSAIPVLNKLAMAPTSLKRRLITLIEREAMQSSKDAPGRIIAKLNSLADPEIIDALYKASNAGVRIDLNVRGICMLVPGVAGRSENITVVSVVGRFLEHARLFWFQNSGSPEVFLSSADWMPRNLDRRIELMVPIEDPDLVEEAHQILLTYFRDTGQAHVLRSDGRYQRKEPKGGGTPFVAQHALCERAVAESEQPVFAEKKEFAVRRRPPRAPG
ncbi:MAG: polyphosphate kinase 1 [Spirochaetaceae bacterium]|nr:MAG: polyphosphate kinase 1 [Spirochaetaceae bacterium]